MAGIYLHIPFCRKACHYCNFHFSTRLQNKNAVVTALLTEIKQEAHRLSGQSIETIYFGGGTPSLLTVEELNSILNQLAASFSILRDAEITLEANPDDIRIELLEEWKLAGINRLSIGVQSFREEDLRWMNRAHTAAEALSGIRLARGAGFENITIDLIYGTPTLTDAAWEDNLLKAIALDIPHLSCYALTVEPKTALFHLVESKKMADTDPEQQARQFNMLMDHTSAAGYTHYEVSNFAREGWHSRHNSAYWKGIPYLGIGPGAHSYDGLHRRWNISNNALYISGIEKGLPVYEEETLTADNRFNEYVMTSLRTMEGIQLAHVRSINGDEYAKILLEKAVKYVHLQQVRITETSIQLTNAGKLFADGIAAEFFTG
ncbi:radical SAM family heme chaperone HemW [Flavihumibacter fluvii]|uniref:radical SAM family heme chaperone HemW n=1 Tax=Flavihumibacter fluvii TaxID=2838157 RepID=UPI001BDEF87A|nr:radical SAM family heme chaperone HemW [Flavihumibacter fluvii]ULQ52453.1 radical SAM family heme chaperone HemW [Flavihumibacter fluvii]